MLQWAAIGSDLGCGPWAPRPEAVAVALDDAHSRLRRSLVPAQLCCFTLLLNRGFLPQKDYIWGLLLNAKFKDLDLKSIFKQGRSLGESPGEELKTKPWLLP